MAYNFAFVVPRYGKKIAGGCETLIREFAERLAKNGEKIDVLTTCAIDNRTWENALEECEKVEDGVNVRFFKVDKRDLEKWVPLQLNLSANKMISLDEQLTWMRHSVNSTGLYSFLKENAQKYDAVFFAPYLFGTTFWGSLIHPENSILIPCLHDEIYAYTDVVASMFRQVKGCVFNAGPEKILAQKLYGNEIKGSDVGMGFVIPSEDEIEKIPPYFSENFNYVLYIGRKETGKNVQTLIDFFIGCKEDKLVDKNLKLVIAGGGSFDDLERKKAKEREDIIDISYLSEEDKQKIIRHCLVLCQPSRNESFSIVIMEAWGLKAPVLVSSNCAVTRFHVESSNGGFHISKKKDFAERINLFAQQKAIQNIAIQNNGYEYVKTKYNWKVVMERFYKTVDKILDKKQDNN